MSDGESGAISWGYRAWGNCPGCLAVPYRPGRDVSAPPERSAVLLCMTQGGQGSMVQGTAPQLVRRRRTAGLAASIILRRFNWSWFPGRRPWLRSNGNSFPRQCGPRDPLWPTGPGCSWRHPSNRVFRPGRFKGPWGKMLSRPWSPAARLTASRQPRQQRCTWRKPSYDPHPRCSAPGPQMTSGEGSFLNSGSVHQRTGLGAPRRTAVTPCHPIGTKPGFGVRGGWLRPSRAWPARRGAPVTAILRGESEAWLVY
jgi:hypothetical protein